MSWLSDAVSSIGQSVNNAVSTTVSGVVAVAQDVSHGNIGAAVQTAVQSGTAANVDIATATGGPVAGAATQLAAGVLYPTETANNLASSGIISTSTANNLNLLGRGTTDLGTGIVEKYIGIGSGSSEDKNGLDEIAKAIDNGFSGADVNAAGNVVQTVDTSVSGTTSSTASSTASSTTTGSKTRQTWTEFFKELELLIEKDFSKL